MFLTNTVKKTGLLALLAAGLWGQLSAQQLSPIDYVDPTIGGVGLILEPTRPAVHQPNSMVRVFPARKDQLDDQIGYFPLAISSHRQPWLFRFMPVSGKLDAGAAGKFSSANERITPAHYQVNLIESGIHLAFTPGQRSGFFKVTFTGADNFLRLGIENKGTIRTEGRRAVSGTEEFSGMKAYFYAESNTDLSPVTGQAGDRHTYLKVAGTAKTILWKYGLSFISTEQAKANLAREIPAWEFDALRKQATDSWNRKLGQMQVQGGTEAQKRVFYTSLYRSYERMVDINEYGKYYSAYDHQVHQSDKPFFVDNWLWDTYIALEPLQTILNPKMQGEKIDSYVEMYKQGGWMPSFALVFGDNPCMTGNHAASWILDSRIKGVTNFDLDKAYEGLRKNALSGTLLPWRNGPATVLDSFYAKKGYMPALAPGEKETVKEVHGFERRQAVSVTLENSYDDWCIAQLADLRKDKKDYNLFLSRAAYYRNVFRKDKGFVWPKDKDGNWIEPFDPKFSGGQGGRDYFTENNAYTYNWDVKHDFTGLFELMGGPRKAEEKLDNLFRESLGRSKYQLWYTFPDATGLVGQFVMGNEPSFHIPYLYNHLGSPWKTQQRIRMLMDTWYTDNFFGIPGDEDGGGMTAFVVFSMAGFFPVTPGIPVYSIGSPSFSQVSIKLDNGKTFRVTAKNNNKLNVYIQGAKLNGKSLDRSWFTHQELLAGGHLELVMGPLPNTNWGTENLPRAAINDKPFNNQTK
ncbi:alpha-mannosidase [Pedobacter yulinensis]|uniref:Alpha-mannosidase n=1 Tax=Pedobacter yulinensis TaxID=2126353 RepID=A0A2T3HJA4_9SPHI|nr:GH92 family glycosyl hydrolase [Pedobacter yulinensis]PST82461.1 alpha-mannosidase [Pedobacter yulinensis]